MISDKLTTKGKPHEFFPEKTQTITTKGIDTKDLIEAIKNYNDHTVHRGVAYNEHVIPEDVAKYSKNYVTTVQFPIITCNDDGSLISSYKDEETGEEKTSHGYSEARIKVNLATMSDLCPTLVANGVEIEDVFAEKRSAINNGSFTPMMATVDVAGETTFEINAKELASVMAKQHNAAFGNHGFRKLEEDPAKARLFLTMDAVKATVDGVGKVTRESLNNGLVKTATTIFIASNSETSVANNKKQGKEGAEAFRNAFDEKTIADAGNIMTKAYDRAVKDVAKALAEGSDLRPLVSAKYNTFTIEDTDFRGSNNVKLIDSHGVKAFVPNPMCTDVKAINADMKEVAAVVASRANVYAAQDASKLKDKIGTTAYNLVRATNFSVNAIGLKKTIDGKTQATGIAILSPAIVATIAPIGANVTRLNVACNGDEEVTKNIVGPTIFNQAMAMAKASVEPVTDSAIEHVRELQNRVIDFVERDVYEAAASYDSIGKEAGKDKQAGE